MFLGAALTSAAGFGIMTLLLLIPLGIILLGCRKGYGYSCGLCLLLAGAVGLLAGNMMPGIYVFLLLAPFSSIMVYCIQAKIGFGRSLAIGMVTFVAMLFACIMIANAQSDVSLQDKLEAAILSVVQQNEAAFQELAALYAEMTQQTLSEDGLAVILSEGAMTLLPALLVVFSLYASVLNYWVAAVILNKKWDSKVAIKPLDEWSFTTRYGCSILIACLVLFFLSASGVVLADTLMNVVVAVGAAIILAQGVCCMYFFGIRWKMPRWLSLLISVLLMTILPYAAVLVGIADMLFRLRLRYMVKKGEVKMILKNGRIYMKRKGEPEEDQEASAEEEEGEEIELFSNRPMKEEDGEAKPASDISAEPGEKDEEATPEEQNEEDSSTEPAEPQEDADADEREE